MRRRRVHSHRIHNDIIKNIGLHPHRMVFACRHDCRHQRMDALFRQSGHKQNRRVVQKLKVISNLFFELDKRIAGYAHEAGKAVVIVVNKWDAVEKDERTMKEFEEKVRDHFQFLDYAPVLFMSALTFSSNSFIVRSSFSTASHLFTTMTTAFPASCA